MVLDQGSLPRIQFAHNPLKIVVAQLRFETQFRLGQPDVLAAIQAELRDTYPAVNRLQEAQLSVQFGRPNAEPQVRQSVDAGPVRFAAEDGTWAATVAADMLSLETTDYREWEQFRDRFAGVLDAVQSAVTLGQARRLGLRFINELTHPDAKSIGDWRRFLDPEMLGTAASERFAGRTAQAREQLTLTSNDEVMTLRHSYTQNPDGTQPSSIYVLDTDVFSGKPFPTDRDAVLSKLERYHQDVWTLFRESLSDEMVAYLNGAEGD